MIVVRTKEELQEAIKNKVDSIRIEGPYAGIVAQKIRSRKKVKKVAIGVGTLALVGGVIAAPFTGGASLAGSAVGFSYGIDCWCSYFNYHPIGHAPWCRRVSFSLFYS